MTSKRKRGAGPRLNDLQRLEIVHRRQTASPPVSLRQLAREFGVDEKTIRRVVAASADIAARTASAALGRRGVAFRRPSPRFPALEKALAAWIDARQRAKAEISPSVVIDKAKLVARSLGISPTEFKASWGWYDKFCRRFGVRTAFVGGVKEQRETGRETSSLGELHARMEEYDPEWVFTVDETTLFYDTLPFKTEVVMRRDGEGEVGGGEQCGESASLRKRVTLVVCCNSTGRLAPPICMVGKETWPRVAQNFPLPYLMQSRAWLDRTAFGQWFDSVFLPFVRQRTSKPVLLVVDGTRPGHQGDFEQDDVRVVFLPPPLQLPQASPEAGSVPSTAADLKAWWTKPLEMGVLAALKARYKYLLVRSALSFYDAPQEVKEALRKAETNEGRNGGGVHFGHAATLVDAARLLTQAWSKVPQDLLENCFARANLVPPSKLLAAPTPPTPAQTFNGQPEVAKQYDEDIAEEIEKVLVSSSLLDYVHGGPENGASTTLRERVRIYLRLDEENSLDFQKQLHEEISEALGEVGLDSSSIAPTVSASSVNTADNTPSSQEPATSTAQTSLDLATQVRELLLGITDVASRLRLLPQAGTGAEKLASLQLEDCIAAADQIRQSIQTFDSEFHAERAQSDQEVPLSPLQDGAKVSAATTHRTKSDEVALV